MLDHLVGAGSEGGFRLGFETRVRLEFYGSKISSDGGLLLFRELDETLGLHDMAGCSLRDTRTGKNGVHNFVGLLRLSLLRLVRLKKTEQTPQQALLHKWLEGIHLVNPV